jgi:chorismate mutase
MVEQRNLDYLREEMQNITNQIIKLVNDRMEVAKKNWQYKTTIEN